MFSTKFVKDAAERAVSTFAQVVLALLVVAGPVGIQVINWVQVVSVGALAAVISVLKSIVASRVGDSESASLVELDK